MTATPADAAPLSVPPPDDFWERARTVRERLAAGGRVSSGSTGRLGEDRDR